MSLCIDIFVHRCLEHVPAGLELAQCMARFGSEVTVFGKHGEIMRKEDRDAAALVQQQLKADGVVFKMNAQFHLISNGGPNGKEVHVQLQQPHDRSTKVSFADVA